MLPIYCNRYDFDLYIYGCRCTSRFYSHFIFQFYFSVHTVCNQFARGVFAMLGAVTPESFDTLHSYTNTFQMPFVTPWFPEKVSQIVIKFELVGTYLLHVCSTYLNTYFKYNTIVYVIVQSNLTT